MTRFFEGSKAVINRQQAMGWSRTGVLLGAAPKGMKLVTCVDRAHAPSQEFGRADSASRAAKGRFIEWNLADAQQRAQGDRRRDGGVRQYELSGQQCGYSYLADAGADGQ